MAKFIRALKKLAGAVALTLLAAVILVPLYLFVAPENAKAMFRKLSDGAGRIAKLLPPALPSYEKPKSAYWLPQNWSGEDRHWFHHASQGTATLPVPYDWFLAFERPEVSPSSLISMIGLGKGPGLLSDGDYLARFGFIPSPGEYEANMPDYGYRGGGAASWLSAEARRRRNSESYSENKGGLPVGFARLKPGIDPATGEKFPDQIGFTCAACHTGQLIYKGVNLRFDGAPAATDLGRFEKAVALSILYTLKAPFSFGRFADRVLGENAAAEAKDSLYRGLCKTFDQLKTRAQWEGKILERRGQLDEKTADEGFARLDALTRIGNQIFFEKLIKDEEYLKSAGAVPDCGFSGVLADGAALPERLAANYARPDAPVSYPPVWGTGWFLWAQYDASISNELVRNAGEALGVGAKINLAGPGKQPQFASTLDLRSLYWLEEMLRGPDPFSGGKPGFKGLAAPRWRDTMQIFKDDAAWELDEKKVSEGRELYRKHCFECHRGPVRDTEFDRLWPDDSFWMQRNSDGHANWIKIKDRSYFNSVEKTSKVMGTDAQQARVLTERTVMLPSELNLDPVAALNRKSDCDLPPAAELKNSFAVALMAVVDKSIDQWFEANPQEQARRSELEGPRGNCPNPRTYPEYINKLSPNRPSRVVTLPRYRARPLDGVWATAPYLHNGSVPNLAELLKPQSERSEVFCVGGRDFDPVNVGLPAASATAGATAKPCDPGMTTFDTSILGNSNGGHSFEGDSDPALWKDGVIGKKLNENERRALIEYLKTL